MKYFSHNQEPIIPSKLTSFVSSSLHPCRPYEFKIYYIIERHLLPQALDKSTTTSTDSPLREHDGLHKKKRRNQINHFPIKKSKKVLPFAITVLN